VFSQANVKYLLILFAIIILYPLHFTPEGRPGYWLLTTKKRHPVTGVFFHQLILP